MEIKLFDSELKVMEVLWKKGDLTAGQISKILKEEIGWNRNTTYTVIKKCVEKGAIERIEPKFICKATISKEEVQAYETEELIDKMFDGSKKQFFAALLSEKTLTHDELQQLKDLVNQMEWGEATDYEEGDGKNSLTLKDYESYGISYDSSKEVWIYNGKQIAGLIDNGNIYVDGSTDIPSVYLQISQKSVQEILPKQFNELMNNAD